MGFLLADSTHTLTVATAISAAAVALARTEAYVQCVVAAAVVARRRPVVAVRARTDKRATVATGGSRKENVGIRERVIA